MTEVQVLNGYINATVKNFKHILIAMGLCDNAANSQRDYIQRICDKHKLPLEHYNRQTEIHTFHYNDMARMALSKLKHKMSTLEIDVLLAYAESTKTYHNIAVNLGKSCMNPSLQDKVEKILHTHNLPVKIGYTRFDAFTDANHSSRARKIAHELRVKLGLSKPLDTPAKIISRPDVVVRKHSNEPASEVKEVTQNNSETNVGDILNKLHNRKSDINSEMAELKNAIKEMEAKLKDITEEHSKIEITCETLSKLAA